MLPLVPAAEDPADKPADSLNDSADPFANFFADFFERFGYISFQEIGNLHAVYRAGDGRCSSRDEYFFNGVLTRWGRKCLAFQIHFGEFDTRWRVEVHVIG